MHNVEPAMLCYIVDNFKLTRIKQVKLNPKSIERNWIHRWTNDIRLSLVESSVSLKRRKINIYGGWEAYLQQPSLQQQSWLAKIASMFAQAFAPITEAARVFMKNSGTENGTSQ